RCRWRHQRGFVCGRDPRQPSPRHRYRAGHVPRASDARCDGESGPADDRQGMTVGVMGAGQLGRMLALAGYPLGLDFLFLDPSSIAPAGHLAPLLTGSFTDEALLAELARRCEVITFDWENVSVEALGVLPRKTRVCPPLRAVAAAQDRVSEKRLFERLGIPT